MGKPGLDLLCGAGRVAQQVVNKAEETKIHYEQETVHLQRVVERLTEDHRALTAGFCSSQLTLIDSHAAEIARMQTQHESQLAESRHQQEQARYAKLAVAVLP